MEWSLLSPMDLIHSDTLVSQGDTVKSSVHYLLDVEKRAQIQKLLGQLRFPKPREGRQQPQRLLTMR